MLRLLLLLGATGACAAAPLTFETTPLGTLEKPILLRTYLPDPGLEPTVLAHHHRAAKSPKYNPSKGQDVQGEYDMIKVLPAAIAVNHGPALSYVFDTVECRILYAWQGGFLDMFPYWGERQGGRRRSFDYVPRLVGNLFYLAKPQESPKKTFTGYTLSKNGVPTFHYQSDDNLETRLTVRPSDEPLSFELTLTNPKTNQSQTQLITGAVVSRHSGFDRTIKIGQPDIAAGEQVFLAYGCIACHSTDGSKGHGPTLAQLFGTTRELENGNLALADESYLRESILEPNAKTAKGFPPNYMPPYQMKDKELQSVLLYLKSLSSLSPE
jgi:mono/diheme cytochrome c family protein